MTDVKEVWLAPVTLGLRSVTAAGAVMSAAFIMSRSFEMLMLT